MRLIMLGAPGSGKGTQGVLLAEKLGVPHVSTGAILRDAAEEGGKLGQKASYYMERGQLLPDELMVDVVEHRLLKPDCKDGFILDGFPRTATQANRLGSILKMRRWPLRAAINLVVDQDILLKRISGRRACDGCGKDFNVFYNPSEKEEVCDVCGGALFQRKDDRKETVAHRLAVYKKDTAPLEVYYRQKALLIEIDGNPATEDVFQSICDALRI